LKYLGVTTLVICRGNGGWVSPRHRRQLARTHNEGAVGFEEPTFGPFSAPNVSVHLCHLSDVTCSGSSRRRTQSLRDLLAAGVDEGSIRSDTDVDVPSDRLIGPIYLRRLPYHEEVTDGHVDDLVATTLGPNLIG
jgi:hypothetical protein